MGSGGGSSSGTISYPGYMEEVHRHYLTGVAAGDPLPAITMPMTIALNTAFANNPYDGETAYDPTIDLAVMTIAIATFAALVGAYNPATNWATAIGLAETDFDNMTDNYTSLSSEIATIETAFDTMSDDVNPAAENEIAASVAAFEDIVDERIVNDALPRIQIGMLSVNSVNTSAFIMAQSDNEAKGTRDVSAFQGDLRVKAFLQKDLIDADIEKTRETLIMDGASGTFSAGVDMEKARHGMIIAISGIIYDGYLKELDLDRVSMHYTIENSRLNIIAKQEQNDKDIDIDVHAPLWNLEILMYGANLLGSIGASSSPGKTPDTRNMSALGGAMTGAALGFQAGGGYGAAIGAVAGGIGGYFTGSH